MDETPRTPLRIAQGRHGRHWRDNVYCYPVVSRRSGGLSIGINLNPDKVCNFDCIYCQVDRSPPPVVRKVDLAALEVELGLLLDAALDQSLFAEPPFDCLGPDQRQVRDIAFSGDGEPTAYPRFDEAVRIAVQAKQSPGLERTKLVLITDACYLTRPKVRAALRMFDENNGEVWAKLDAGTQGYYEMVNRPNFPLSHVVANIIDAARLRAVVIQSLWMRVHGESPPQAEIQAFADRLREIVEAGGRIKGVQVYTVARTPAERYVAPLAADELDNLAALVRDRAGVPVEVYPGDQD